MVCRTAGVVALLIAFSDGAPPTTPQFHVPFTGGCCADVTALGEYQGVAHLFKENTGVPGGRGLGFAHYVSKDFVNWVNLPSILQPGAADGSVNFHHPGGPTILWDCTSGAACNPEASTGMHTRAQPQPEPKAHRAVATGGGCRSGDAAIIGVARAADPSDANLTHWVKDARNPIYVGPDGTDCYAGPSNLWRTEDGKTNMVMIYNTTTGLFSSNDPALHNWTLVNDNFYPRRGGGGGLFFPLPGNPQGEFTHMLQSDFPGQADGTAYYALGRYNEANASFDCATTEPRAIDFSNTYVYNQLGARADGTLVNAGWIRQVGTSVVREVTYDEELQALLSYPVRELASLRTPEPLASLSAPAVLPTNGSSFTVLESGGQVVDIELVFALPAGANDTARFNVNVMELGGAVELAIGVANEDSSRVVNLRHRQGNCNGTFVLPKPATALPVRILVDVNFLETFAGLGRGVCSSAIGKYSATAPVQVQVETWEVSAGAPQPTLERGVVWGMGSIPAHVI